MQSVYQQAGEAVCHAGARARPIVETDCFDVGMLGTREKMSEFRIGLGDEVYMLGLFQGHTGRQRNEVICRRGCVAMIPSEPVVVDREGTRADVYLMEVRSIGGFSGSPVVVSNEGPRFDKGSESPFYMSFAGQGHHFLWGLVSGHWDIPLHPSAPGAASLPGEASLHKAKNARKLRRQGRHIATGIAIVVPAYKVLDILCPST